MPLADRLSLADGAALLHPLLMILFVYPVGAVTVRLATHVRERRLDLHPQPASVLVEHAQHGPECIGGGSSQQLEYALCGGCRLLQLWHEHAGLVRFPSAA